MREGQLAWLPLRRCEMSRRSFETSVRVAHGAGRGGGERMTLSPYLGSKRNFMFIATGLRQPLPLRLREVEGGKGLRVIGV